VDEAVEAERAEQKLGFEGVVTNVRETANNSLI
jgi:hypothetical protein